MVARVRYPKYSGYIGLARQVVKGTGVVPSLFFRWVGGSMMMPDQDVQRFKEGGDGQYPGLMFKKLHKPDGGFDLLARPDAAAALFGLLLGKQVSTGAVDTGENVGSSTLGCRLERGLKYLNVVSATDFAVGEAIEFGAATLTELRTISLVRTAAATGSSTLSSAFVAGSVVLAVASSTGFIADDYVSIGAGATLELHKVQAIPDATHITIVDGLVNAQITGAACVELTNVLEVSVAAARVHASGATVIERQLPYTHVFTPCDLAGMPWATLERSVADLLINRFLDVRIQKVEIEAKSGEPVRLKVSYLAIDETRQTAAQVATYETDMPFIFWQGVYTVDGTDESAVVTEFNLVLTNEFDAGDQTNSFIRADIPLTGRDVSLTWTMKFETVGQYAKVYLGGVAGVATSGDAAASTGTFSVDLTYGATTLVVRGMKIEVPNVYLTKAAVEIDAGGTGSQEYVCEGQARKVAGAELVTVTVKNGTVARWTDA